MQRLLCQNILHVEPAGLSLLVSGASPAVHLLRLVWPMSIISEIYLFPRGNNQLIAYNVFDVARSDA